MPVARKKIRAASDFILLSPSIMRLFMKRGASMRLRALVFFALAGSLLPYASAQSVISAHSGLVNYFEGEVFLDGQPLAAKPGIYAKLKPGSTLMTADGRAEVLLTPNTYFRIGEKSTMRMLSDSLSDTRVELMAGSASIDSANAPEGDFVRVVF